MTPAPPDPSLPSRLRAFHRLPLAGTPPNALLSMPDDHILYLVALLRDTSMPAPALSAEAWREFPDHLRPRGVFPLKAFRLRTWPEDCRPPREVMAWLNRVFLSAAARTMKAGRQIQEVVDALEKAGTPSVLLEGPALARTVYLPCRVRRPTALRHRPPRRTMSAPQTDSDKPVKFVDLHLCESEASPERTGL